MAEVALFISEQDVKDLTVINGNVDVEYIRNTIYICQKLYIRPILGTGLYDEVSTQVLAGTVSADNQTLIDEYIKDCLVYYTVAKGISYFTYKIENKSIVKKNSDNSSPIDAQEVQALRDENMNIAQEFGQLMINFLQANASATKYPLYLDAGDDCDTIHPKDNDYRTGWVLD